MGYRVHDGEEWERPGDEDDDFDSEEPDGDDFDSDDETIACPHCGRDIYEDTPRCPHCHEHVTRDDRTSVSKPWWIYVTVALLLLTMFGWLLWELLFLVVWATSR